MSTGVFAARMRGENRISIVAPAGKTYSKSFCMNIPESGDYIMLMGADNYFELSIDGKRFASCQGSWSKHCYNTASFYQQTFTKGAHVVTMRYQNENDGAPGLPGAAWFETYRLNVDQLRNATEETLNPPGGPSNIVFSTGSLVGENAKWYFSGEDVCPLGTTFDACGGSNKCVKDRIVRACR